jgi:hypothetical protein
MVKREDRKERDIPRKRGGDPVARCRLTERRHIREQKVGE